MAEQFYQWDSKSLIETQFSLATSKPNSHWQHQSPILIGNNQSPIFIGNNKSQFSLTLLYQKRKEPKTIKAWQKKKIYIYIMLPKQERLIASIHEETQKNVFTNKGP